ncbi:cation diffusion facilitator family transporter [Gephyromycinifex aptenodytis]|uniref:cation diffusion facilitator family transporter n=1 Tax=Gephyromycinifex aptenodytis TaxID=2716227 RepID=UPI001D01F7D9|nr:cation diffusion facilitator family transporter [Gephyromycinifex aptenodytis]
MTSPPTAARNLARFAWLAIAAAIATIALKTGAWYVTGSVGLLSDAAESLVNLVAAVVALVALQVAALPADKNHQFGHAKAEYFSAASEGIMIFVAALFIIGAALERVIHPAPVDNIEIGLVISVIASVINAAVAFVLLRAGRKYRSHTLIGDGKHLLTDVWTTVGVVLGVGVVALTGWHILDPIVALAVGINIIIVGWRLLTESMSGLMDVSWPKEDNARLARLIREHTTQDVDVHALRTREAGHRRYVEFHILVPGAWNVQQAHDLVEEMETAIREAFEGVTISTHLEPREDPRSYSDFETEVALPVD